MRKRKKPVILENFLVEDYAAEGKSLGRRDGKVVFVERSVPGDVVDVYLFKNKKDWADGFPVRFHEYSEKRVTPFCQHFGDCGGCQWQMVPYEEQLAFKQQQVKDALTRIGKVSLPEFLPILGGEKDRYYRNKLEYTFGAYRYIPESEFIHDKPEKPFERKKREYSPAVGFHAKGLFDKIVDIKHCHLQAEPSNAIRETVRKYADAHELTYYNVREHHGFLRNLQIRLCKTGEIMVNLVVGEDDFEKTEPLLRYLQQEIPSITSIVYTVNTKMNDSLHGLEPLTYTGKGYVIEKLSSGPGEEDFSFKIGPKSFFQTNTLQAEQLYRVTREFAELSGNETLYDLYCGTGSIGIFCSRLAKKIIGVEMIDEAIKDARENAALNNIKDVAFFTGDVIDICNDEFFSVNGKPDVIITDPPRAGMHEKLTRKILDMSAPIVIYVSCNPATQGRDLNILDEKYAVTKVQPVDMFPHTSHMENVVQLKLR